MVAAVNDDCIAVEIVGERGSAFLVGADEYRSLCETVYLLRSPANAERLRASIAESESRRPATDRPASGGDLGGVRRRRRLGGA